MTDVEQLICPKTGMGCRSVGYCALEKIAHDGGAASPVIMPEHTESGLPPRVVDALGGFCSDQRLQNLAELNVAMSSTPDEQLLALRYIHRIAMRQARFNSAPALQT